MLKRGFLIVLFFAVSLYSKEYFWIQLNAQGEREFRVSGVTSCPSISCDGESRVTRPRFEPSDTFKTKVCSVGVQGCNYVKYGNRLLEQKKEFQKVAIIGDTGCRVKVKKDSNNEKDIQNCNDPDLWPAKKISDALSKHNPDLVVHVGDYLCREMCENKKLCKKFGIDPRETGYGYDIWEIDFFEPFEESLQNYPWVFARGNHENCDRAWEGYKSMLSPFSFERCKLGDSGSRLTKNRTEEPYLLDFGGFNIFVVDSAGEYEKHIKSSDFDIFEKFFTENKEQIKGSILLTHKPIYNLNFPGVSAQTKAYEESMVEPSFILSGHIHLFEYLSGQSGKQLVVGNSGTKLDVRPELPSDFINKKQVGEFGFVIIEKHINGFLGTLYSSDNEKIYEFSLE